MLPQLIDETQAATRLRMPTKRVVRLAQAGLIPHIALPDGEVRFDADDLQRWIKQSKVGGSNVENAATANGTRTPPELARDYRVSPDKVRGWIESGELRAINVATKPGGRPRYIIHEADIAAFEQRRAAVTTPTPNKRRKGGKKGKRIIEFY